MTTLNLYQNDYVIVLIKKSEWSNAFKSIDKYNKLVNELEHIMILHGKELRIRFEEG